MQDKLTLIDVHLYLSDTSFDTPWQHWTCDHKILVPDDLEDLFGVKFKPFNRWHFPEKPSAFEQYLPKPFKKDDYKIQFYSMTSITPTAFISVYVDSLADFDPSPECSLFDREKAGLPLRGSKVFPGQVYEFQIISRSLEKK